MKKLPEAFTFNSEIEDLKYYLSKYPYTSFKYDHLSKNVEGIKSFVTITNMFDVLLKHNLKVIDNWFNLYKYVLGLLILIFIFFSFIKCLSI